MTLDLISNSTYFNTYMKRFSEDSRVKIPSLLYFTRLGYEYLSVKEHKEEIHPDTNIFIEQFQKSISRINDTELTREDAERIIRDIHIKLSGDDLGRAFYGCLLDGINGYKLIDFENIENNLFQVVTELTYKKEEDEFRPDIIPLLNGMPLSFVEVKIPNNREGIQAERDRIHARFRNKNFRAFANLTQILVFSNNSEYNVDSVVPIEGAFYATPDYESVKFNCFREEEAGIFSQAGEIDSAVEDFILKDTNYSSIRWTEEYLYNRERLSPTNKIIASLFTKERYLFMLKYAFAYVEDTNGTTGIKTLQKHIMRYPQVFATKAIQRTLDSGTKKGVIWHTQGSGKTALSYYNVKALTDYFQKRGTIAKFYFIVDRLDLMKQAAGEFGKRGLSVELVKDKSEFISNIQSQSSNDESGNPVINVVNIQKFSADSVTKKADYNLNVQRVYFLDEAHRSYNPKGSFLANLINSDRDAVIIALTGTPLIGEDNSTKATFGDYIHKYYYNQSIADGYTLKLLREGIKTEYRIRLAALLDELETEKGSLKKRDVFAHPRFAADLTEYIVHDFMENRVRTPENFGGMVVCDTSDQARAIFEALQHYDLRSALILHDEDDKKTREDHTKAFKDGDIDILVVFNMLLTGFDAPRLKRLYLGRVVKAHNLLQTLTRVNRPYKSFRYGYVVDFADIREEFEKTNKAYFAELQNELGDSFTEYSEIFKDAEEISAEISKIQDKLFMFDTENMEVFSSQVTAIDNKEELRELYHALDDFKSLYNLIRLLGYEELLSRVDIERVKIMFSEVSRRIGLLNFMESLENKEDMSGILNMALDQIEFMFRKVSEDEMVVADSLRDLYTRTLSELNRSNDKKDAEYLSLMEELRRIFAKKNVTEGEKVDYAEDMRALEELLRKAKELNRRDDMLCSKYGGDAKFLRVHKRLKLRCPSVAESDASLFRILIDIKSKTDEKLLMNAHLVENEAYFTGEIQRIAVTALRTNGVTINQQNVNCLKKCISREYFAEREMAVI